MNRHPLISSQSPSSSQRAVPCMTIRLTSQIITQLNQSPPPRISFCIKDRIFTINDVKHPLQAFVEDPSLCEVYVHRSDRLFQVGNIEQKLIVQREVNAKNASNSTPKVSESNSAHSNPLAPKQTAPSSQRAKRPRNSAATNTASKRPATSNNSTPRRRLSHSPMDPKPASPERHPTPAGLSKSSKLNSSLSLRDQVLHLLAIQPMSAAGIGKRLSQPIKNLASILKAVAQYEVPGKYRLRDDLLVAIRIDSWPYSEAEKDMVLKNIESVIAKTSDVLPDEGTADLASLSIEDDCVPELTPKTPKTSSKRPSPQLSETVPIRPLPRSSEIHAKMPQIQQSGSNPKRSSVLLTEANLKKTSPHPSAPAKEWVYFPADPFGIEVLRETNLPAISSHEEYLSCRSRFELMYPRYSAIDVRLKEIAAEFNSMAVKLDSPQCPPAERKKIQHQVKQLYAELKPEVDRLKLEFNTMHEEMSMLKSRIRIYVDTVLTPL